MTSTASDASFESATDLVPAGISRVGVRRVDFWKSKPKLWFHQLEAQFDTAAISVDKTKSAYLVQCLDEAVIEEVSDLLEAPYTTGLYDRLKDRLTRVFAQSEEKRLKTLLTDMDLTGKRPSQLLRYMKSLGQGKVSDEVIKSLWLQRIPSEMTAILMSVDKNLDELAEMADKIDDLTRPSVTAVTPAIVAAVPSSSPVSSTTAGEASRDEKIDRLIAAFERMASGRGNQHKNARQRRRNNSRRRPRSTSRDRDGFCRIHRKYGAQARSCFRPCSWNEQNSGNSAGN